MKIYGTLKAASYLGLTLAGIKYHIAKKHLRSTKVGHSLFFFQSELNRFNRHRRKVGRPKNS